MLTVTKKTQKKARVTKLKINYVSKVTKSKLKNNLVKKVSGKIGIELDKTLIRREVLRKNLTAMEKEFKSINSSLKKKYEGYGKIITPNHVVSGSYTKRSAHYVNAVTYWTFKVFDKE